jgi:hypothetical protein
MNLIFYVFMFFCFLARLPGGLDRIVSPGSICLVERRHEIDTSYKFFATKLRRRPQPTHNGSGGFSKGDWLN